MRTLLAVVLTTAAALAAAPPADGAEGGFRASREAGGGVQTVLFSSLRGTVRADLPQDLRTGDTISGRVRVEPAGETDEKRRRNGEILAGLLLDFADERTPAADGFLQRTVPLVRGGAGLELTLRDSVGAELARAGVALTPLPGTFARPGPPRPEDFRFAEIAQSGRPLVVDGPFDGSFLGTSIDLDRPLELLAESPRRLLADTPAGLAAGPYDVVLREGGVEEAGEERGATVATGRVHVLELFLSATDLDLRRGQTTLVTARVEGLQGLPAEAYPLPFEMVNHSPEVVRFVTLEDLAFEHRIGPGDVSAAGSYTFATTLRASRTGTFHISATVFPPLLFDPVLRPQDPACGEQTRLRALCVRFFLLDACGGKDRKGKREGLFAGVEYGGENFGKVPEETTDRFQSLLDRVNRIWAQCVGHCCWIRFYCHEGDKDKPCVQAFDPEGVPAIYRNILDVPYDPEGWAFGLWKASWEKKVDLCQLFDKGNPRGVTVTNGNADVEVAQSVTWAETKGPFEKGEPAKPVLEEKAGDAEAAANAATDAKEKGKHQARKKRWEDLARDKYRSAASALDLFGQAVDGAQGETCINVFVLDAFQDDDPGRPADEAGYGSQPGRNVFLEDAQVTEGSGRVLAHELGHNLDLGHEDDDGNLMDEDGSGTRLDKEQCDKACDTAGGKALRPAKLPEDEAAKRRKAEEEEREKEEEERKKKEEEEGKKKQERERAREREKEIDRRLGEIDERARALAAEIEQKKEKFKKSVEDLELPEKEKKKILADNLENQAPKEQAELQKLEKEKAALEKEKAGLGGK